MSLTARNTLAVIGAGPIGLEAACAALERGFDVHVFELRLRVAVAASILAPDAAINEPTTAERTRPCERRGRGRLCPAP